MTAPLTGIRVLDLTRLLPGNYATLLLAGLGAEVVKIEDPGSGDGIRWLIPCAASGESGAHAVLNRGKQSVAIDLKRSEGRELLLELAADAQVLIDAFRPGVMDRLGLSGVALAAANPDLVHVTIDAYGSNGPYQDLPAHDLNAAGFAGVIGIARDGADQPAMPSVPAIDHMAGLQAVVAVMAGLRHVARSSGGFRAEVAMSDTAASLLTLLGGYFAATGCSPPTPELLSGQLASYGLYECADGLWLTVAGLEPKFFGRMVQLMGLPELASVQFDPAGQDELRSRLAERFAVRPRAEWLELLAGEDTCVGPVNDVAAALADPNLTARGVIGEITFRDGTAAPVVRAVPWLSAEPSLTATGAHDSAAGPAAGQPFDRTVVDPTLATRAPTLGEQTTGFLAKCGIAEARIAALRDSGVIAGT